MTPSLPLKCVLFSRGHYGLIGLTWGKWAVVDAEDYDRVSQYNWCGVQDDRCWYAHTLKRDGMPMAMHRLILGAPKGLFVDHIDHNGLNNRRSNLRLCTNSQNQQNTRPRRGGTSRYKGVWLEKKQIFLWPQSVATKNDIS